MTKRDRPSTPPLGMQIECLFRHFPILCAECGERINWDDDFDWDHWLEWADVRRHSAEDIRPIHRRPCHKIKSKRSEVQRHRIDRLEREKNGEPKRARDKYKKPIHGRGFDKGPHPFRRQPIAIR